MVLNDIEVTALIRITLEYRKLSRGRTLKRTGRPIAALNVRAEERERLKDWARRPTTAQALAQRSRIVLECATGLANTVVASKLEITHQTVGKWRQRFLERGLDGLLDEPRPGAPRQVTDAQIERVVRLTLESTPADATHWSTRAMAKRCGLSQTMVSRIWRAFALQLCPPPPQPPMA